MKGIIEMAESATDWPAWLSAIGTLLVSVVAILLALFKEKITAIWKSPELVIELNPSPPDSHKTIMRASGQAGFPPSEWPVFYWRMRILNKGKSGAENVEVIVASVEKKSGNTYKKVDAFPPENLVWSTYFEQGHQTAVFMPTLSPGTYKFCNLGYAFPPGKTQTVNPAVKPFLDAGKVIFQFQVKWQSNIGYWQLVPGVYRFVIWAAASNSDRVSKEFEIEVDGDWTDNEGTMLSQRVSITEV